MSNFINLYLVFVILICLTDYKENVSEKYVGKEANVWKISHISINYVKIYKYNGN